LFRTFESKYIEINLIEFKLIITGLSTSPLPIAIGTLFRGRGTFLLTKLVPLSLRERGNQGRGIISGDKLYYNLTYENQRRNCQ
jgi:hypothetical protein